MKGHSQRGALAACAFVALTGAIHAADSSVSIDIHRMNLDDPKVVAALYARIQQSARMVCMDASSPWQADRAMVANACAANAVADAVKQANAPRLTALHARARLSAPEVVTR